MLNLDPNDSSRWYIEQQNPILYQSHNAHLSKRSVELHHIELFLHCTSKGTGHCQHTATVVPLDTDHIHQSINAHWV